MLWKFREIMNNNLIWASPLIVKGSVNGLLYHRKSVCEGKLHFVYILTFHFPENYILTQSTVPEIITTINEGDNVTIVCKVSGNGIKRVEWYKDKLEIPSRYNNTGDFNVSIADLTAVTVAQAGEYECRTSIVTTPYYFGYQAETFLLQVIGKGDCCSMQLTRLHKVNISNCLPQYNKTLLTLMNIIRKGLWTPGPSCSKVG